MQTNEPHTPAACEDAGMNDEDMHRGTVLVTGARGQLGRSVVRSAAAAGIEAVGLARAELDVTDAAQVRDVVGALAPRVVVHCGAWTDVDGAESDRDGAFAVNAAGTRTLAEACDTAGARLVLVSTDYVFDGERADGYVEDDATAPLNVYGASKLAGDLAALEVLGARAAIVRTAWLFSEFAPNFVQTIARVAAERDAIDVVDDQRGCPTWCGHLADALVELAARDEASGIFHLVDAPDATWFDLAREVVTATGAGCEVRPTTTDAFPRPAKRAAFSILRSTRPDAPAMGDWRDGVRASVAAPVA